MSEAAGYNWYSNDEAFRKCFGNFVDKCGQDIEPWVRSYTFLEGSLYRSELNKYHEYLLKNKDKKNLFLELGVVTMTPMFIKEPFWNMTYSWPNVDYIAINPKDAVLPRELIGKELIVKEDIVQVFQDAVKKKEKGGE